MASMSAMLMMLSVPQLQLLLLMLLLPLSLNSVHYASAKEEEAYQETDVHGITKLYASNVTRSSHDWMSDWLQVRSPLTSGQIDPQDNRAKMRGSGTIVIGGGNTYLSYRHCFAVQL